MLDLLSGLLDLLSWLFAWRLLRCVAAAPALITSIHYFLADGGLRTGLSVAVGVFAVVVGVAWEFARDK